ncbi:MAG TPA: translation initiation factor IF-2 N-terminal domain-containing protein, partial [Sphingobacteriaceae bacterium]
EPAPEEKEEKRTGDNLPGVKVVGRIDLDNLKPRGSRPDKKAEEEVAEEKKAPEVPEVKAEEVKPVEKPVEVQAPPAPVEEEQPVAAAHQETIPPPVEQPEPKAEKPAPEAEPTEEEAPSNEVVRAKAERLSGPNVIGKIELPAQPRRTQPVASSSNVGSDHKRKRKRKDGPHGQTGTGSSGPATGGGYQGTKPTGAVGQPGGRPDFRGNAANRGAAGNRPDFRNKARTPETSKAEPTEKEIQDQIKATLARLSGAGKSGKFSQRAKLRRQKRDDVAQTAEEAAAELELQSKILKVTEFVTANELASLIDVPVTQIISTCMSLGMFVSINQRLDAETLTIVAEEFGYQIEFVKPEDEETNLLQEEDREEDLLPRAPIVTVMGHVDHGKTSLLDFVRKTNVIGGEAGGITQHIGAYEVTLEGGRKITFLDTPGHEAFTAMRARGAQVTDIAIIVIAADDSVMPQTREAINHAQAAGVPIVFAFSKVDKPGANADKIREQLSAMNILVEDWGGKYQSQEISGKTGMGIDLLLEKVLLEAELLELKANPNKRAVGTVIEAALDKGRGIVTT